MIVFRLSKSKYAADLSGKGAEMSGGRWNSKGTALVYTSQSAALCTVEIAMHVPLGIIPLDYTLVTIEIPDDLTIQEISPDELPSDWNALSHIHDTQLIGDQFIKSGMYKNILVVGAEKHSFGLDQSTRGRNISVIFGDGAGAVVLQPTEDAGRGILSTHLHSDGTSAEILAMYNPGTHANHWVKDNPVADFDDAEIAEMFMSHAMIDNAQNFPFMDGPAVFKKAVVKFPEVIQEALQKNNLTTADLKLLVPHQANLRIAQFVQKLLRLRDDQVYNNIEKYGNTTAASIPIALSEAWEQGRIEKGDLVCLAAFGSGFTWASALLRW